MVVRSSLTVLRKRLTAVRRSLRVVDRALADRPLPRGQELRQPLLPGFLCYYKILEGIYCRIRPDPYRRAKSQGITINAEREAVPDHLELRQYQPGHVGSPVKDFFDTDLRSQYRDAVAIFALDSGLLLNPSAREVRAQYADIILPAELACRVVVDQQQALLDQYYAAGGSPPP